MDLFLKELSVLQIWLPLVETFKKHRNSIRVYRLVTVRYDKSMLLKGSAQRSNQRAKGFPCSYRAQSRRKRI